MKKGVTLAMFLAASLLGACDQQASDDEANRVGSTDEFQTRIGTPIDLETHPGAGAL